MHEAVGGMRLVEGDAGAHGQGRGLARVQVEQQSDGLRVDHLPRQCDDAMARPAGGNARQGGVDPDHPMRKLMQRRGSGGGQQGVAAGVALGQCSALKQTAHGGAGVAMPLLAP